MNFGSIAVAVALSCVSTVGGAQILADSGFGDGSESWIVQNGAGSFQWVAGGGDPGGYIRGTEVANISGLWFFAAPAAFLGDKGSAYGGTLAFSMRSTWSAPEIAEPHASVQLLGANGVLLAFEGGPLPTMDWTRYSVSLVADGAWRLGSVTGAAATSADMQGVLSDLLALRINGDFGLGSETSALDSVVLTAVPEPVPLALLLAGLGVVFGRVRRAGGLSG
jgi:hypothetical protein